MTSSARLPAVFAYLVPIVGWLYVVLFQRKNAFAVYHLRQSVGLFLFLIGVLVGWAVIAWVLALIPLLVVVSMALFTIVIAAYVFGIIAWIMGMMNALRNESTPLPLFGQWADRLPIQ
jgi:uncharacterized membrane protein